MITFLYDKDNNLISELINSAILNPEIIKVKNKLLDGTYHIQSIGDKLNVINIICYVDKINKEILDDIYITDEPVKLVKENKYYTGIIIEKGEWKVFTKNLYSTEFKLVVEMEGVI